MRRAIVKSILVGALIAALVLAIGRTPNESPLLGLWFILFIFVSIPLALLSIRDLIVSFRSGSSESSRAWLLLHVCALFAAGVGFLIARLAKASGHPKAEWDEWLVVVLPALVYLTPVFVALHSGNFGFLAVLWRPFRRNSAEGAPNNRWRGP